MDTEKTDNEKKPIIDQMTDMAAEAAGNLAETGVRAAAKKAKQEVAKRLPRTVKKAGKTITRAASARRAKKATAGVRKAAKKATKAASRRVKKAGKTITRAATSRKRKVKRR
ncbi:hypothetical protein LMTR3_12610 [Bradyrhizobium sp. LMTR 3]|nr:hypothetical protein LMTR3_12610 [Bradyrhizobium sp. LMTR 3]